MAYSVQWPMSTGECEVADCEANTVHGTSACTSTTSYAATGNRSVLFPLNTAAAKAIIWPSLAAASGNIYVWSGSFSKSGSLTSSAGIITSKVQSGTRFLVLETSHQFQVYDGNGNKLGPAFGSVPTATSGVELVLIADGVTLSHGASAKELYFWAFIDGLEVAAFPSGMSAGTFWSSFSDELVWGEWLAASTNRGADIYGDDLYLRRSTTAADSPWLAQYPRLKGLGGNDIPPTSDGDEEEWALSSGSDSYALVDDDDGDTNYIQSTNSDPSPDDEDLFHFSAANPLGGSETIVAVQQKVKGRILDTGKLFCEPYMKLGGSTQTNTAFQTPSTSFVGTYLRDCTRPGGGSWAPADFDLTGGVSDLQFGLSATTAGGLTTGPRVTFLPGPEIVHYTASLPLASPPVRTRPVTIFTGLSLG